MSYLSNRTQKYFNRQTVFRQEERIVQYEDYCVLLPLPLSALVEYIDNQEQTGINRNSARVSGSFPCVFVERFKVWILAVLHSND